MSNPVQFWQTSRGPTLAWAPRPIQPVIPHLSRAVIPVMTSQSNSHASSTLSPGDYAKVQQASLKAKPAASGTRMLRHPRIRFRPFTEQITAVQIAKFPSAARTRAGPNGCVRPGIQPTAGTAGGPMTRSSRMHRNSHSAHHTISELVDFPAMRGVHLSSPVG